jgi:hypothetical protein
MGRMEFLEGTVNFIQISIVRERTPNCQLKAAGHSIQLFDRHPAGCPEKLAKDNVRPTAFAFAI